MPQAGIFTFMTDETVQLLSRKLERVALDALFTRLFTSNS